jgi:glutaredoxin
MSSLLHVTWLRISQIVRLTHRLVSRLKAVSMPQPNVILYTRTGCHLCDEAAEILSRNGLTPKKLDIDSDSALAAQFTECVPVVEIDGKVRFRGRVDEMLLRRLLSARA